MQALILEQQDGKTLASVQAVEETRLPEGDVTVDIDWSSLNYKDALAITGKGKIIRNFPMVPGIDFAGRVHSSEDPPCGPAGAAHRLGRGRKSLGRAGNAGAREGRLAGAYAERHRWPQSDDRWYRRLYRHAVRDGAGRGGCSPRVG